MTTDGTDGIASYHLDGEGGEDEADDLPAHSYWWSLHRPESYALASLVVATAALLGSSVLAEVVQALLLSSDVERETALMVTAAVHGGLAIVALGAAWLSIRSEDEDATWSPPVARAALLVAALTLLLAVIAVVAAALSHTPTDSNVLG